MDLSTICSKLISYRSVEDFQSDLKLMFNNCIKFNGLESEYSLVHTLLTDILIQYTYIYTDCYIVTRIDKGCHYLLE